VVGVKGWNSATSKPAAGADDCHAPADRLAEQDHRDSSIRPADRLELQRGVTPVAMMSPSCAATRPSRAVEFQLDAGVGDAVAEVTQRFVEFFLPGMLGILNWPPISAASNSVTA
jgi:hypothetical protein